MTSTQRDGRDRAGVSHNDPDSVDYDNKSHGAPVQVRLAGRRRLSMLVDPEDRHLALSCPWYARPRGYTVYAQNARQLIHRLILGAPEGVEVDHIDGDGLNNRRCNLRLVTRSQQMMNRRGWGKSRFVGVAPWGDRWQAYIAKDGRQYNLGLFDREEDAALARDAVALKLHGEYARLNFPEVRHG